MRLKKMNECESEHRQLLNYEIEDTQEKEIITGVLNSMRIRYIK